jgi:outer membrane protein
MIGVSGCLGRATLVILAFMASLNSSNQAAAETLFEALATAYETNPALRAAQARQRGVDEQVPQALSGWRPKVTLQGSLKQAWSDSTVTKEAEITASSVTIELSQPVFRGFKTIYQTKFAESNVEAGKQNLLAVEQNTIFQAIRAYMDVIRDRQVFSLRSQNVNYLRQQLKAATTRFAAGEVTRTDVAQSRASAAEAQASAASAQADLAASIASFVRIVGRSPETLRYPKIPQLPGSLDEAQDLALTANPELLAAAYVEEAANYNIEVVKGDLLPDLYVSASATATANPEGGVRRSHSMSIQGVLSIPLYEAGQVYSRVRQSRQVASQHRLEVIQAARSVREGVSNDWYFLEATRQKIQAGESLVAANGQALDGVKKEFQVGSRSTLDVLDAQGALISARISLVSARRDQIVAAYQVLSAIGRLTARDLKLPVTYYDPDANYLRVRGKWAGTDATGAE